MRDRRIFGRFSGYFQAVSFDYLQCIYVTNEADMLNAVPILKITIPRWIKLLRTAKTALMLASFADRLSLALFLTLLILHLQPMCDYSISFNSAATISLWFDGRHRVSGGSLSPARYQRKPHSVLGQRSRRNMRLSDIEMEACSSTICIFERLDSRHLCSGSFSFNLVPIQDRWFKAEKN